MIEVEGLSKHYRLGVFGYGSLQQDVASFWARLRGRPDPNAPLDAPERQRGREFWALRDVSFSVEEGEVLGVIGGNGAGKSTLLKILARITAPTRGRVRLRGRVASMLEVGTGFHPELTGRENIFLNGAILGMSREEISRKFDEIVDFSGVEAFIDTPVKRYSSGMYVRLAFAVAAHLEPEILLVDEVLAVGDAAFQKKCLGKMESIREGGRTILFVSHNLFTIQRISRNVLWIDSGGVRKLGEAGDVLASYRSSTLAFSQSLSDIHHALAKLPADPAIRIEGVDIRQGGNSSQHVVNGLPVEIVVDYHVLQPEEGLRLFISLRDSEGFVIFRSHAHADQNSILPLAAGRYQSTVTLPENFLAPLSYQVGINAGVFQKRRCFPDDLLLSINVEDRGVLTNIYDHKGITVGLIAPDLKWTTTRLSDGTPHNATTEVRGTTRGQRND